MNFFISDTHFHHKNVLRFCSSTRPVTTVEDMNETIIKNWNEQVTRKDNVYILGDFSFSGPAETTNILRRLKGNLNLIRGNHDRWVNQETSKYFDDIRDYREVTIDNTLVVMMHYPIFEWRNMHRGAFHLFGHVHGNAKVEGRAMDVGIDARPNGDMKLWSWDEIKTYMLEQPIRTHHKG